MPNINEAALIQQARQDPAAFEQLYLAYVDTIFHYAYRRTGDKALAEDITAATFETALRKLNQYTPRGRSFAAWLYTIARSKLVAHFRRQKFLAPFMPQQDKSPSPEEKTLASDRQRQIQAALSTLKQADQDIITLRFYQELSSEQVADILGTSKENVYLRLHRALQRLRAALASLEITAGEDHETE